MLNGELGVSKAFLEHWYIGSGYMDVSEVVVFMIVANVRPEQHFIPLRNYPKCGLEMGNVAELHRIISFFVPYLTGLH